MDYLTKFISFEKPMGETLTRLLFYIGIVYVLWTGLGHLWKWIQYFDNDWDTALWGVIKTPFIIVVKLLVLRVMSEYVLARFRMDKSLHDQVTGRAAPKAD